MQGSGFMVQAAFTHTQGAFRPGAGRGPWSVEAGGRVTWGAWPWRVGAGDGEKFEITRVLCRERSGGHGGGP